MKINHTTGNWIFNRYSNDEFGVYSDTGDGRDIALVRSCKTNEETEANVKLIASAPELLLSLEDMVDILKWLKEHLTDSGKEKLNHAIHVLYEAVG